MNRLLKPALLLAAGLLTVFSTQAAENRVLRSHSFGLGDVREVEIKASVGEMNIQRAQGGEVRLELEIEGRDRGWFRGSKDVSEVDLESRRQGDRLVLSMDEEDTNTRWTVYLPAVEATNVDMGVGEMRLEVGATELDVNLGVGEVHILAPRGSTGNISLHVGVGEARVEGAEEADAQRAFVSQTVHAFGQGERPIRANVGVGEARLRLD